MIRPRLAGFEVTGDIRRLIVAMVVCGVVSACGWSSLVAHKLFNLVLGFLESKAGGLLAKQFDGGNFVPAPASARRLYLG